MKRKGKLNKTSVVAPQHNKLICPCVYHLKSYGHLNNSSPSLLPVLKEKMAKIDVAVVFS